MSVSSFPKQESGPRLQQPVRIRRMCTTPSTSHRSAWTVIEQKRRKAGTASNEKLVEYSKLWLLKKWREHQILLDKIINRAVPKKAMEKWAEKYPLCFPTFAIWDLFRKTVVHTTRGFDGFIYITGPCYHFYTTEPEKQQQQGDRKGGSPSCVYEEYDGKHIDMEVLVNSDPSGRISSNLEFQSRWVDLLSDHMGMCRFRVRNPLSIQWILFKNNDFSDLLKLWESKLGLKVRLTVAIPKPGCERLVGSYAPYPSMRVMVTDRRPITVMDRMHSSMKNLKM